ncbi:hypothetical protein K6Y31_20715 [Motilimonas cestriensis]|uniref:Uncharacterized protein n=1 Tax=Motilimonas cestriensis TaxID=2742685 RepID=A0ABS8WIL5_9GAMM|nr:hypothetical protein [Motilimonas cestriensis]MCE2597200.1 hypothetical protein [Motilimonas cestriensis]
MSQSLKGLLLAAEKQSDRTINVLGHDFPVRRLTAARLAEFEQEQKNASDQNSGDAANRAAAGLVLESLLDESGQPMSATTTVDELLQAKSPASINSAMSELLKLNFMAEGASTKAKKK